jgi:NTP pyrophosphatase (non-canonical NTP hydrolase)
MNELVEKIEQWGADRGITQNGTKLGQATKLFEEATEILDAISKDDTLALADGIGDVTVVLIMLSGVAGLDYTRCVNLAYTEIKDRTGHLREDGVFVKDK